VKLTIPEYQTDIATAQRYVLSLWKELSFPELNKHQLNEEIKIPLKNGQEISIDMPKEIECARKNGKAHNLQFYFDQQDKILNTPFSLAMLTVGVELRGQIKISYDSHTSESPFPGLIEAPETSFSTDIAFYRKEAVRNLNEANLEAFARSYRAYLQSCISLVDCFVYRYFFHAKIDSRASLDERLGIWISTFATDKQDEYKRSSKFSKFMELKKQRNNMVHPASPSVPYGVKEVVKFLNYAKDGIGGFLAELRRYAGEKEDIGFIRLVRTQQDIKIIKE
jgi:hypothetical protein